MIMTILVALTLGALIGWRVGYYFGHMDGSLDGFAARDAECDMDTRRKILG